MRFTNRIRQLEVKLKPEPSCPGCGYPQRGVLRVILTNPLAHCGVCGRPLDENGAPLHAPMTRIILEN